MIEALVSPAVLEATNGIMLAALVSVAVGALVNFAIIVFDVWGLGMIYKIGKPSIALVFGFGGLALNTGTKWFLRWLQNHGHQEPWWAGWSETLVIAGAVLAVVGLLCWLRVTLPEMLGLRGWLALLLACLLFGVGMAVA